MRQLQRLRPSFTCMSICLLALALLLRASQLSVAYEPAEEKATGTQEMSHGPYFLSLAFSPDSSLLASGGSDKTVRIWDCKTHRLLRTLKNPEVSVESMAFSRDGKLLISGGNDGTACIWNVQDGRLVEAWSSDGIILNTARPLVVDGRVLVATALGTGKIQVRTLNGDLQTSIRAHVNAPNHPLSLAVSSDNKLIASTNDFSARLWDAKTLRRSMRLEGSPEDESDLLFPRGANGRATSFVAFSPDAARVAASIGGDVLLWDVATGKKLNKFTSDFAVRKGVYYSSPSGEKIVTASNKPSVIIWDVKSGKQVQEIKTATLAIAVSPDGKTLAYREGKWIRFHLLDQE